MKPQIGSLYDWRWIQKARKPRERCWWCGNPGPTLVELTSPDGHPLKVHGVCATEASEVLDCAVKRVAECRA